MKKIVNFTYIHLDNNYFAAKNVSKTSTSYNYFHKKNILAHSRNMVDTGTVKEQLATYTCGNSVRISSKSVQVYRSVLGFWMISSKRIVFAHVPVTLTAICLCLSTFIDTVCWFLVRTNNTFSSIRRSFRKVLSFQLHFIWHLSSPGPGGDMTSGEA